MSDTQVFKGCTPPQYTVFETVNARVTLALELYAALQQMFC